jgi:hypothetical protein
MTLFDAPEGMTIAVTVYLKSETLNASAVIRVGEFTQLPQLRDTFDVPKLAERLPPAGDWRLMTRDEIKAHTGEQEDA